MSEPWADWLSYRPSDFLMFSPRAYWRLFEMHNSAWWPWQVLALALGAVAGVAVYRGGAAALRLVPCGLAVAWGFAAWAFHAERYVPINWAAIGLAWLFAAQSLVLMGLALLPRGLKPAGAAATQAPHGRWPPALTPRPGAAVALWLFALVLYPCLAPLQGRPMAGAEVIGLAPDPTVLATLAWLLATPGPTGAKGARGLRAAAWALALAAAAASAATLATMGEWQALAPLTAMVLAVAAGWQWPGRRRVPPLG